MAKRELDCGLETSIHRDMDPLQNRTVVVSRFQDIFLGALNYQIVERIASQIAERYVAEHYAEIVAKLDQNAIANLAVADAGKKIAEEIRTQPTVLHDVQHHTEVYQRGIFGGLRRL